jgi:two-component system, chemotaxis family, protein-glutamate methylesterase/glutaminase
MMVQQEKAIIVIGASAGGVEALQKLVKGLPPSLPASIFVVLHIAAHSPSRLPQILSRASKLSATFPQDYETIKTGHLYIAPPDHHMLLEKDTIRVVRGPKENRHRPAIDPLFRSAAQVFKQRVVGVVLTGALDDGTAGLSSIKQEGGISVVQDPDDALYSSMPQSALDHVPIDYVLPLAAIPDLLIRLAHKLLMTTTTVAQEPLATERGTDQKRSAWAGSRTTQREIDIILRGTALDGDDHPGTPSAYSCPGCGGVLWEIKEGKVLRYCCRVGHAYSVGSVLAEYDEKVETALWAALKTLEESASLTEKLAISASNRKQGTLAARYEQKAEEARANALAIQNLLTKNQ